MTLIFRIVSFANAIRVLQMPDGIVAAWTAINSAIGPRSGGSMLGIFIWMNGQEN
ncbi:MAG: hypothetical protein QME66_08675 [Candidatus Eisenbacteria bacterium]|nr:hypothetical protein [Candidatus Eisenbacteria bacterium]